MSVWISSTFQTSFHNNCFYNPKRFNFCPLVSTKYHISNLFNNKTVLCFLGSFVCILKTANFRCSYPNKQNYISILTTDKYFCANCKKIVLKICVLNLLLLFTKVNVRTWKVCKFHRLFVWLVIQCTVDTQNKIAWSCQNISLYMYQERYCNRTTKQRNTKQKWDSRLQNMYM